MPETPQTRTRREEKARSKQDRRTPGVPYLMSNLPHLIARRRSPQNMSYIVVLGPRTGTQRGHSQPLKGSRALVLHARTRRALAARGATPRREALNGAKSACSSVTAQKPCKHLQTPLGITSSAPGPPLLASPFWRSRTPGDRVGSQKLRHHLDCGKRTPGHIDSKGSKW